MGNGSVRAWIAGFLLAGLLAGCALSPRRDAPPPRTNEGEASAGAREEFPRKFPTNWLTRQRMTGDREIPVRARAKALSARAAATAARARTAAALTDSGGAGASIGIWQLAGPENVGGRVTALGVDPNDADHIWLGSADGGVWESTNGGASWSNVWGGQTALSIGSIVTHPTDSSIVYVGTGEDNGAGYSYDGEGVFKTTDGGQTWTNMGLADTRRIGRIALDPVNPQRVFVAAGGNPFVADANRGVYRSIDGGQNWQQVLFVTSDAGAREVAIDPSNPNRIYASIWQRLSSDTGISFGGADSGVWQTTDGGDTWSKLTTGLPSTNIGRIGLAISPSDPNIVIARYQTESGGLKGFWKSNDSGVTWFQVDNGGSWKSNFAFYGYYFAQVRFNPNNSNILFALDVDWFRSNDGGISFQRMPRNLHVDHHDFVIQAGRALMGNDGGFYSSIDNGQSWFHATDLSISQFYDICIDTLQPLRRFGGLQDNGTVRTTTGGLADWQNILGGDGLQCEVDPTDSDRVYASSQGGNINRSTNGGDSFSNGTNGISGSERTNWNAPLAHDPVTSQKLYTGTIRVYRTTDGAVSWQSISPNLTNVSPLAGFGTPDRDEFGRAYAHLEDLVANTVTTIGVSPVDTTILWAGTDDGNVWVTDDDGANWTQVNVPGRMEWVTRVTADPFDSQSAYVTFSGFRSGSRMPRVFRTTDLGASWSDISGDLPDVPLNDVIPDPMWKGRLFVGSDLGAYQSDDWGVQWDDQNGGLPLAVIHDLVLDDPNRTLFAGTHGRSMWSYDLNQLGPPDRDGDGAINVEDCAPDDAGAFAVPLEIQDLDISADTESMTWLSAQSTAGSATVHDVLRGRLDELPVGSGPSETCVESGTSVASATDSAIPAAGIGFWYVARGRNACGTGSYGATTDTTQRSSAACP